MSPDTLMRPILIMAGGTGGHVYPALAVADHLREKEVPLFWLGTRHGLEARVIPAAGIELLTIDVAGLRGKGLLRKLSAPFLILRALWQSVKIMLKIKPAMVLGMGGFASGPGGLAAWLCRIPLCIHEQNAIAGLTNRLLSPFARVVMQAFPNAFADSNKVKTVGNPLRTEMTPAVEDNEHNEKRILVVGGSLGAMALNRIVPEALSLMEDRQHYVVRHQTGEKHLQKTVEFYQQQNVRADVIAFIDDMAKAYQWADIVICRAGAMTVAEVSAVGVATIFVPFPYAVDDHQTANARYLSDAGGALLIQESELDAELLHQHLSSLLSDAGQRKAMANTARRFARLNATHDVAQTCWEVAYAK